MEKLNIPTHNRTELVNITSQVRDFVSRAGVDEGICHVYVPHTTAGVTINEAADPDVASDLRRELDKIVPFEDSYAHGEGNSAAHIKTSIVGSTVSIPVSEGRLALGTWQGIFFGEFDGPRRRSVYLQIVRAG